MLTGRMTSEQRRLVEENMGLVGLHIRRHVRGLDQPTRQREWDDLFQEGCLGLALAATTYDRSKGIPFAAFALRRIQPAVHRALHRAFATVRLPDGKAAAKGVWNREQCKVVSLDFDAETRVPADRHHPENPETHETVGARIRHKYDEAVHRAARCTKATCRPRNATRGLSSVHDAVGLIDRLVEERLLVPNEEDRVSLRQISRETKASYARVTYTEKRLRDRIRSILALDPELAQLRLEARKGKAGVETEFDEEVMGRVASAVGARFAHLFQASPPERRGIMLLELLQLSGMEASRLARSLFDRSPEPAKSEFFARWAQDPLSIAKA